MKDRRENDSCVYVIKLFNLNSRRNEKFELFSQVTYEFQNFENKTLFIADHENFKKSASEWLVANYVCSFE